MATVTTPNAVTTKGEQAVGKRDLNVVRWAGAFGVAGFVVFLVALPLYFVGPQPAARLEDTVQFSDSVSRAAMIASGVAPEARPS